MPFSSDEGKQWTKPAVKKLKNICNYQSVLDVGTGAGFYSDLLKTVLP